MPEQVLSKTAEFREQILHSLIFSFVGITIGISQLMNSGAHFILRVWVGRAVSTGGLAMSAGAILVWFPDVPFVAQCGIAAALASVGTSSLVHIANKIIDKDWHGRRSDD